MLIRDLSINVQEKKEITSIIFHKLYLLQKQIDTNTAKTLAPALTAVGEWSEQSDLYNSELLKKSNSLHSSIHLLCIFPSTLTAP